MGTRYFAFSFDDGLEQDRRIIEILKKYGLRGTFNLNSGLFGYRTEEPCIWNLGYANIPVEVFHKKRFHMPYVHSYRVEKKEAAELYKDMEVASHSLMHEKLPKQDSESVVRAITEDLKNLREIFDQPVIGMAYPYGLSTDFAVEVLKQNGVLYARTVGFKKGFSKPAGEDELYHLPNNCWPVLQNPFKKLDAFLKTDTSEGDQFFQFFSHGYEMDIGSRACNWERFEKVCRMVSEQAEKGNLVPVTVGEALERMGCFDMK